MTASFANATVFVCCYMPCLLYCLCRLHLFLHTVPSYRLTRSSPSVVTYGRLRLLLPCPSPSVNALVFHRRSATRRRRTTTTRAGSASSSRSTTRRTARFTGEWGAHVPGRGRGGWNHSAAGAGRECKRLCQFVELSTWCCFVKVDSTSLSILWIATCICVSCFTT